MSSQEETGLSNSQSMIKKGQTPLQINSTSSKNAKCVPHITDTTIDQTTLLVLVNPHSGRGTSMKIYAKHLVPFLNSNHLSHELFVSEHDLRVTDFIQNKTLAELKSYKCILVVAGDGLLHEAVNALMNRPDWQQAIDIPLGIVPTGSGNGMAYTLLRQTLAGTINKEQAVQFCCEQAISGQICPVDLVRLKWGPQSSVWSFLSIGWGLLADIDIDSEWLRSLGELRFTLYGLLRSVTASAYKGRLSYKPALDDDCRKVEIMENLRAQTNFSVSMYNIPVEGSIDEQQANESSTSSTNLIDQDDEEAKNWIHIEDKFSCFYGVHQSYISSETNFAPKSTLTDQLIYLSYIRGRLSVCQAIEFLLAIKDGSHEKLPYVTVVPVTKFIIQPLEPSKVVVDGEVILWKVSAGPLQAEVFPKVMKLAWRGQDRSTPGSC